MNARLIALALLSAVSSVDATTNATSYGVDVSFPVHHLQVSTNYPHLIHNTDPESYSTPLQFQNQVLQPLGNKQEFYDHYIQGCREYYGKRGQMCDSTEKDRIKMSLTQPRSMKNYTNIGFKKIRAPDHLFKLLKDHWDRNEPNKKKEKWSAGNTYVNHWASPTYMTSVEDVSLRGGGGILKQQIWDAARPVVEEWTGQRLTQSSLYGIRAYTDGAVLAPHVDRNPLISSCIINVAQDVDEDWPLEVIGHDGLAYNVTMEPGDMVLYESHSLLHARPFPLKGRFFANVFVHFEPEVIYDNDADSSTDRLPTYILEGSEWAEKWYQSNHAKDHSPSVTTRQTPAHHAARDGKLDVLHSLLDGQDDASVLHEKDNNGWQPLHEAVRAGHVPVVQFLVENGANVNERTNHGKGGSPLWWARQSHDDERHPVIEFLLGAGAEEIESEL
jgi:hypothetical protein